MAARLEVELRHLDDMSALKVKSPDEGLSDILRNMRKGDFLAVFGGSHKVNIEWAAKYGMPWREGPTVDAVEILNWYRSQFMGGAKGDLNNQKIAAEIEKLKMQTARLKREEEEASGALLNRYETEVVMSTALATFSESMMTLPDKLTPRFPVDMAVSCTDEIRRDIERHLVRLSESSDKVIGRKLRSVQQLINEADTCPKCQTPKVCPECQN